MNLDHDFFTGLIVDELKKRFRSQNLLIQSDLKEHQNPPRDPIYVPGIIKPLNSVPDVYARDDYSEPNVFILGEAKTENDFRTCKERRDLQLDYYFNYLKYKQNGLLVYALPRNVKNILEELIVKKKNEWDAKNVKYIILTEEEYVLTALG